jgi:cytochrome P450
MTVHTECPHLGDFDPGKAPDVYDPWPTLARARDEQPVFFLPQYGMWVVTRYADVREALKDIETFSSAGGHINFPAVPEKYRDQLAEHPSAMQLNTMDPPRHTYLRRIAQKAFTPATAKAREPEFRQVADRLLDDIIDQGRADLIEVFASIFPLYTAASMLGLDLDPQEAAELKQYATDAVVLSVDPFTEEQLDEAMLRAIRFDRFMRGVIEERRKNLGDDVVSLLIKARDDESDQALNDAELVSVVTQSLVGGIDTTGALIARMAYMLLSVHERWDELCADPDKYAATIVEETLRMHGPIRCVGRTTTRDVEVAGTTIPAGSLVLLHTGSASRDPAAFEDPERFDMERSGAELGQQLGLGRGTHFCLGAPFARVAGRVALKALAERLPDLRLADPDMEIELNPSLFVVAIQQLDVAWGARQPSAA